MLDRYDYNHPPPGKDYKVIKPKFWSYQKMIPYDASKTLGWTNDTVLKDISIKGKYLTISRVKKEEVDIRNVPATTAKTKTKN